MAGSLEERVHIAEAIADGEPMQRIDVPLAAVLAHAKCPRCEGAFKPTVKTEDTAIITIEGKVSASPRDRLASLEFFAKYSIGGIKEVSVEEVREKIRQQLMLLESRLPEETFKRILPELESIWKG